MKIALSASYFNCPPVRDILMSCDVVYTTNPHALATFLHPNIKDKRGAATESIPRDVEIIDFSELRAVFNNWVANTATDEDLIEWSPYFKTKDPNKMREVVDNYRRLQEYLSNV